MHRIDVKWENDEEEGTKRLICVCFLWKNKRRAWTRQKEEIWFWFIVSVHLIVNYRFAFSLFHFICFLLSYFVIFIWRRVCVCETRFYYNKPLWIQSIFRFLQFFSFFFSISLKLVERFIKHIITLLLKCDRF